MRMSKLCSTYLSMLEVLQSSNYSLPIPVIAVCLGSAIYQDIVVCTCPSSHGAVASFILQSQGFVLSYSNWKQFFADVMLVRMYNFIISVVICQCCALLRNVSHAHV